MMHSWRSHKYNLPETLVRWICFSLDPRWSRSQKHQLIDNNAGPQAFIDGYTPLEINQMQTQALQSTASFLQKSNHHCVVIGDNFFPDLLAQIPDPPLLLYAVGDLALLQSPCLAIVGSRRPTEPGVWSAELFATQLSQLGITIVSGMALGIDGCAHAAALAAGGKTVAVLASGVDVVYPARHRAMYERICQCGLVVSEYPLGYPALPYRFPERNRIVSGLSLGAMIVEAAEKSGTLITARMSMEQNREVFVLPGSSLSSQYAGSHRLIQSGAHLVIKPKDILSVLSRELTTYLDKVAIEGGGMIDGLTEAQQTTDSSKFDFTARSILDLLRREPMDTDRIVVVGGFLTDKVSAALQILELEGLVARTRDGRFYTVGQEKHTRF